MPVSLILPGDGAPSALPRSPSFSRPSSVSPALERSELRAPPSRRNPPRLPRAARPPPTKKSPRLRRFRERAPPPRWIPVRLPQAAQLPTRRKPPPPRRRARRVTAVASEPRTMSTSYVGAAQGGVRRRTHGAATWTPATDQPASPPIGALGIDPSSAATICAGTGESNSSCDSYFGAGI